MTAIIDFNVVCQYAKIVHYSQMFGTKNEYEAAIIVAMCFQENISFMQFKRDFHFILGNISKKADAMLASFQADGGKKKIVQADENKVVIDFEINGEKYQGVADWEKLQNEPFTRATKDANGKFYAPNVPLANRLVKENYATPIKRGQMLPCAAFIQKRVAAIIRPKKSAILPMMIKRKKQPKMPPLFLPLY